MSLVRGLVCWCIGMDVSLRVDSCILCLLKVNNHHFEVHFHGCSVHVYGTRSGFVAYGHIAIPIRVSQVIIISMDT